MGAVFKAGSCSLSSHWSSGGSGGSGQHQGWGGGWSQGSGYIIHSLHVAAPSSARG